MLLLVPLPSCLIPTTATGSFLCDEFFAALNLFCIAQQSPKGWKKPNLTISHQTKARDRRHTFKRDESVRTGAHSARTPSNLKVTTMQLVHWWDRAHTSGLPLHQCQWSYTYTASAQFRIQAWACLRCDLHFLTFLRFHLAVSWFGFVGLGG